MSTNKSSDGNKKEDCFAYETLQWTCHSNLNLIRVGFFISYTNVCLCLYYRHSKGKITPYPLVWLFAGNIELASRVEHNVFAKIIITSDKSGLSYCLELAHNCKTIIGT